jgi:hypothetical protein
VCKVTQKREKSQIYLNFSECIVSSAKPNLHINAKLFVTSKI